jgi:ABC-type antimicrobial peptide transport system permease subunit
MSETTQQFGLSWPLVGYQIVAILICIAVIAVIAGLALVVWRVLRKKPITALQNVPNTGKPN